MKQAEGNDTGIVKQEVTPNENDGLQVELDALRQQLNSVNLERERERELMYQQIDLYKERLERADKDKDQLTALLTNHSEVTAQRKGLWRRLWGD